MGDLGNRRTDVSMWLTDLPLHLFLCCRRYERTADILKACQPDVVFHLRLFADLRPADTALADPKLYMYCSRAAASAAWTFVRSSAGCPVTWFIVIRRSEIQSSKCTVLQDRGLYIVA